MRARCAAALEGLNDDHAPAAARAWVRERGRLVAAGGILVGFARARRRGEQLTGACDVVDARAAGKQTIVTDAVEAGRQYMDEEAADELVGVERHRFEPVAPCRPIVLPAEGDAVAIAAAGCSW